MTSVESAVSEFLLACEADGLKDSTIRWYRSILTQFAEHYPAKLTAEMTTHEIREYLADLRKGEKYVEESVRDYTRALHRFWAWAAIEYEFVNPMYKKVAYPKPIKVRKPKAVSLETVIAMFHATKGGMNTTRDRAILAFALDTGCRAGGICGLRAEDVDMNHRCATVTEKGSKTRVVFFTRVTAALLQDWMNERQPSQEIFFYSLYTWDALRPNSLYLLFKRLARRAGVRGKFNPHGWRHAFSIHFLKNGGNIAFLSRILGHESVDTTARHYAMFMVEEVQAAHEQYSPLTYLNLFNQEDEDE